MAHDPSTPPPPPPPPPEAHMRRRGCLRPLLIALGVLAAIAVVGAIVANSGGDDGDTDTADTTVRGPESQSGNEENPPPADLNNHECTRNAAGPLATGTLTNHSSKLAGYMISVDFENEAGTRVAEGTSFVNHVQPGQTTNWEVSSASPHVDAPNCEVVSIERLEQ